MYIYSDIISNEWILAFERDASFLFLFQIPVFKIDILFLFQIQVSIIITFELIQMSD